MNDHLNPRAEAVLLAGKLTEIVGELSERKLGLALAAMVYSLAGLAEKAGISPRELNHCLKKARRDYREWREDEPEAANLER